MPVVGVDPLSTPWRTSDPFLFCVHHVDAYGRGDGALRPAASLRGRQLGQDFAGRDGWNMYHGQSIPGFPAHPHRGFETITFLRRGVVDHADSLGAAARFGAGDCQWLTAGAGIVHAEMFPLLRADRDNPLELFQIWLNLAPGDKMAPPHFAMLWAETLPRWVETDPEGGTATVQLIAGRVAGRATAIPPRSWAARPTSRIGVFTVQLTPHATYELPAEDVPFSRSVHLFSGEGAEIAGRRIGRGSVQIHGGEAVPIRCGPAPAELLVLQGARIGKPVAQAGPFVMNTRAELEAAYSDYRRTRFGGWPWPSPEPVHPAEAGRFARLPDGTTVTPPAESAKVLD